MKYEREETAIKKTILHGAVYILIFTVVSRVIGFIYRIYLSNVIGPEGMGIYQIVFAVFGVLITLTSSGIPVTVSRQSAIYFQNRNSDSAERTVTAAAIIGLVTSGVISLGILLFQHQLRWVFADSRCMPIFLCLIPAFIFSSIYSACRGGLWGEKNFFLYSFTEFVEEILLVLLGVILLQFADGIFSGAFYASLAVCISYCVAAVVTFVVYVRRRKFFQVPKGFIKPLLKSSMPLTGIRLCSNILNSLIAIIIPARLCLTGMSTSEALSAFGIMSGMTLPLLFLPDTFVSSVALLLVPELSADHANRDPAFLKKTEFAISFAVAVALMCMPAFIACGPGIGQFLYQNDVAGMYLRQCAFVMIFMCLSLITNTIMNSMGLEYKTMKNFLVGASSLLLCIWFLPKYIGIYALMVGYCANLFLNAVLNLFTIRKHAKISLKFLLPLIGYAAVLVPAGFLSYYVYNIASAFLPLAVAVLGSCAFSFGMCAALAFLFKFISFEKLGVKLPEFRKKKKKEKCPAKKGVGRFKTLKS